MGTNNFILALAFFSVVACKKDTIKTENVGMKEEQKIGFYLQGIPATRSINRQPLVYFQEGQQTKSVKVAATGFRIDNLEVQDSVGNFFTVAFDLVEWELPERQLAWVGPPFDLYVAHKGEVFGLGVEWTDVLTVMETLSGDLVKIAHHHSFGDETVSNGSPLSIALDFNNYFIQLDRILIYEFFNPAFDSIVVPPVSIDGVDLSEGNFLVNIKNPHGQIAQLAIRTGTPPSATVTQDGEKFSLLKHEENEKKKLRQRGGASEAGPHIS